MTNKILKIAIAVGGVIAVILAIVVLSLWDHQRWAAESTRLIPNDAIATSAQVAAVCQAGSYEHRTGRDNPWPGVPGVTDVAVCTGKIAWTSEVPVNPGGQYGPIWILQFSSPRAARNDVATQNMLGATALGVISGKPVLFAAMADYSGFSLQPLAAQFGFSIS